MKRLVTWLVFVIVGASAIWRYAAQRTKDAEHEPSSARSPQARRDPPPPVQPRGEALTPGPSPAAAGQGSDDVDQGSPLTPGPSPAAAGQGSEAAVEEALTPGPSPAAAGEGGGDVDDGREGETMVLDVAAEAKAGRPGGWRWPWQRRAVVAENVADAVDPAAPEADSAWTPVVAGDAAESTAAGILEEEAASAVTVVEERREARPAPSPATTTVARDAESFLDEGNVHFNVSQYQMAIECYSRAIELNAGLAAAYYNRANAHSRAGDVEAALADYDRAAELTPDDADVLNNRGMLQLYRANYGAALHDFGAALVVDPSDTTVMVNRGLAHLHSGETAAALMDFQGATGLDPEDAAAHFGIGQCCAVLGDRDQALIHLARALAIEPAYAREAASDAMLTGLRNDPELLRLVREAGDRAK